MRTILVSILCLSLISLAGAEDKNKKKGGQGGAPSGGQHHANAAVKSHPQHTGPLTQGSGLGSKTHAKSNLNTSAVHQKNTTITNTTVNKNVTKNVTKYQPVKFKSAHIQNSHLWVGPQYVVFRNYVPVWHTQAWWIGHHSNFVFFFGAPYYWDAGFWYPAWGYYPNSFYYYEGPIYAGSETVSPMDMVMRVQSALKVGGYYTGPIDGILGDDTQSALADYQEDHGLYQTSAIDEPTLKSLGLS